MKETEILKEFYESINRFDIHTAMTFCHPEIVRIEPEGFPSSGTYRGIPEIYDHFTKGGRADWAEGACTPEKIENIGNKFIVYLHVLVRLKNKQDWIDARMVDGFIFKDKKIIFYKSFFEAAQASEWAKE